MEEYDLDCELGLFTYKCVNEIDFDVAEEPGWIPFKLEGSFTYNLLAFSHPRPSAATHSTVPARYQD